MLKEGEVFCQVNTLSFALDSKQDNALYRKKRKGLSSALKKKKDRIESLLKSEANSEKLPESRKIMKCSL